VSLIAQPLAFATCATAAVITGICVFSGSGRVKLSHSATRADGEQGR
jgi:hypothetical protein